MLDAAGHRPHARTLARAQLRRRVQRLLGGLHAIGVAVFRLKRIPATDPNGSPPEAEERDGDCAPRCRYHEPGVPGAVRLLRLDLEPDVTCCVGALEAQVPAAGLGEAIADSPFEAGPVVVARRVRLRSHASGTDSPSGAVAVALRGPVPVMRQTILVSSSLAFTGTGRKMSPNISVPLVVVPWVSGKPLTAEVAIGEDGSHLDCPSGISSIALLAVAEDVAVVVESDVQPAVRQAAAGRASSDRQVDCIGRQRYDGPQRRHCSRPGAGAAPAAGAERQAEWRTRSTWRQSRSRSRHGTRRLSSHPAQWLERTASARTPTCSRWDDDGYRTRSVTPAVVSRSISSRTCAGLVRVSARASGKPSSP